MNFLFAVIRLGADQDPKDEVRRNMMRPSRKKQSKSERNMMRPSRSRASQMLFDEDLQKAEGFRSLKIPNRTNHEA